MRDKRRDRRGLAKDHTDEYNTNQITGGRKQTTDRVGWVGIGWIITRENKRKNRLDPGGEVSGERRSFKKTYMEMRLYRYKRI